MTFVTTFQTLELAMLGWLTTSQTYGQTPTFTTLRICGAFSDPAIITSRRWSPSWWLGWATNCAILNDSGRLVSFTVPLSSVLLRRSLMSSVTVAGNQKRRKELLVGDELFVILSLPIQSPKVNFRIRFNCVLSLGSSTIEGTQK